MKEQILTVRRQAEMEEGHCPNARRDCCPHNVTNIATCRFVSSDIRIAYCAACFIYFIIALSAI